MLDKFEKEKIRQGLMKERPKTPPTQAEIEMQQTYNDIISDDANQQVALGERLRRAMANLSIGSLFGRK
jgi:hypothetical protein